MFEKVYDDSVLVTISNGVIAAHAPDGAYSSSNVDYYFDERGYGCESSEAAADLFHSHFCEWNKEKSRGKLRGKLRDTEAGITYRVLPRLRWHVWRLRQALGIGAQRLPIPTCTITDEDLEFQSTLPVGGEQ